MANNTTGKKEKQKLFRMTNDVLERFETFYAEKKGDTALTYDEIFEIMLKICEEQNFSNKHPGRKEEIESFSNDLERIRIKYNASLEMYDSVKEDTEHRFKSELQEKTGIIADLVSELNHLKESLQEMEDQLNTITEENTSLKDTITKLEVDLAAKDAVINSNKANVELAKSLTEMAEAMTLKKDKTEEQNTKDSEKIMASTPQIAGYVGESYQTLDLG